MKKDIKIPEVTNVFMAVVKEFNEDHRCDDWNSYLINDRDEDIEMAILVFKGYDEDKMIETSLMRKTVQKLPAKSFAKIEFIQKELHVLTNFYNTTFFIGNQMFEKRFEFPKNTIQDDALKMIPQIKKEGIIAEVKI